MSLWCSASLIFLILVEQIMKKISFINNIASWFETRAFGVCDWWGKKLAISPTPIRMYFIYLSFFTVGSPVIIYFFMAFILEHKEYFKPWKSRRKTVWDL